MKSLTRNLRVLLRTRPGSAHSGLPSGVMCRGPYLSDRAAQGGPELREDLAGIGRALVATQERAREAERERLGLRQRQDANVTRAATPAAPNGPPPACARQAA